MVKMNTAGVPLGLGSRGGLGNVTTACSRRKGVETEMKTAAQRFITEWVAQVAKIRPPLSAEPTFVALLRTEYS